jgi:hypothetical protein
MGWVMSKIFISYKSEDASIADSIKTMLETFGFDTFQDKIHIEPSDEWQQTILRELMSCDMFLCILSKHFLSSPFCLQETGVAAARGIPVLPISIDNSLPPGFISRFQAKILPDHANTLDEVSLLKILIKHEKEKVVDYLMNFYLAKSSSFRTAEARMETVLEMKEYFADQDYVKILEKSKNNDQIWCASKCITNYLPKVHAYALDHVPSYRGSDTYHFFKEKLNLAD